MPAAKSGQIYVFMDCAFFAHHHNFLYFSPSINEGISGNSP